MIKYYTFDIFKIFSESQSPVILIHGCNCFNTMGAGFAKQIKDKFPEAYNVDKKTKKGDPNKLGNFSYYTYNDNGVDRIILNAYIQYNYGRNGTYINYIALINCLLKIKQKFPNYRIIMPKIGSGLAGGNWELISSIISTIFPDTTIEVYSLE